MKPAHVLVSDHYFRHLAQNRITANYIEQVYRDDNNEHPYEKAPIRFDVTEAVLAMDLHRLYFFVSGLANADLINSLAPPSLRNENPFRIDGLFESLDKFFLLIDTKSGDILDVTQVVLDAACEAHQIGVDREYQVLVEYTDTRQVLIDVSASSAASAERKALCIADSAEFLEKTAGEPIFTVAETQALDVERNDQPATERPKA